MSQPVFVVTPNTPEAAKHAAAVEAYFNTNTEEFLTALYGRLPEMVRAIALGDIE